MENPAKHDQAMVIHPFTLNLGIPPNVDIIVEHGETAVDPNSAQWPHHAQHMQPGASG